MARQPQNQAQGRDWYSVPVSSVRHAFVLFFIVIMLLGGGLAYQRWEMETLEDRAKIAIDDAAQLSRQLEARDDYARLRRENFSAWEDLESARAELASGRFRQALDRARTSHNTLKRVLRIEEGEIEGRIRFVKVQGNVEYRRGERGTWRRARIHDTLNPGDWVKTTDGSAEIRFADGSEYVLRRDTMVHLDREETAAGASEPVTDIVFGWVELNTADSGGRVKTPRSNASVGSGSEALVSFDRKAGSGRFASYSGDLEVETGSGQKRRLSSLQEVTQEDGKISAPVNLPGRPALLSPRNEEQFDYNRRREVTLRWRNVSGADRYHLMVSRSPLFATNLIETEQLRRTTAKLAVRGQGIFYWQVSAISGTGSSGPWSEPQQFRIADLEGINTASNDQTPPELEIEEIQTFGKVVLVSGRTEPGAEVSINSQPATVQLDGAFNKTIEMNQVGFAFIEVVATDAWKNTTDLKRRVFIDAF